MLNKDVWKVWRTTQSIRGFACKKVFDPWGGLCAGFGVQVLRIHRNLRLPKKSRLYKTIMRVHVHVSCGRQFSAVDIWVHLFLRVPFWGLV